MKKEQYKREVVIEQLIESRLQMQSTQRGLLIYGVKIPTLKYILSPDFFDSKYSTYSDIQKKSFLQVLAGPFNWIKAKNLIESANK